VQESMNILKRKEQEKGRRDRLRFGKEYCLVGEKNEEKGLGLRKGRGRGGKQ